MLNVVLFGATGATGKAFIDLLCGGRNAAKYTTHRAALPEGTEAPKGGRHLTAVTRRDALWPVVEDSPKPFGTYVLENHVMDFEKMEETLAPKLVQLKNDHGEIDTVFCAHGTTMKQAGNDEAFIHIDKDMTVEMARQAKAAGVKHFSLVSSAMTSVDSMFLYPRTKAQTIEEIKAIGFERFSVFKPGLLIAERPDARTMEKLAVAVDPFLSWVSKTTGLESLKVLQSITVEDLAASMIANALRPSPTGQAYEEYETAPDILALNHKVFNP
jgi:uncharacterized protein YbjT (DUF2867 family)